MSQRSLNARSRTRTAARIAVCVAPIASAERWVHLVPAGSFRAWDGRPHELRAWRLDRALAQKIIDAFNARGVDLVVDYEHQTLRALENGQAAPAAGWVSELAWREPGTEGKPAGLWGRVSWTERARTMLAASEYRYLSPVFAYDEKTGAVTELLHAALTNNPALDQLSEIELVAASAALITEEYDPMNELLTKLLAALGLPESTTEADALAACAALRAKAASDVQKIAALSTETAASAEAMKRLQADVLRLSEAQEKDKRDALITAALSAKKLLPAQEAWARTLSVESLTSYLATVEPIAALGGTQTGGKPPAGKDDDKVAALTAEQREIAKALGVSEKDYAAAL